MESNYRSSLILSRANASIQCIAARLKESHDAAELRRIYTSLAACSKRALLAIREAEQEMSAPGGIETERRL